MDVKIGLKSPQVGIRSNVHSRCVADKVDSSTVQDERENSILPILVITDGRSVPVITNFLVDSVNVNEVTSPTGSMNLKSQVKLWQTAG